MPNFTEVRCLALDFKEQNYGCEIEMTGLTREQAARAVAAQFGTTARRTRESVTYDPWEVLDNDGKKWRFVYDGSISAVKRCGQERLSTTDTLYKVELNSPVLQYSEMEKLQQVIRTLRHAGAIVNTSCGMHVHVDAAHHTPQSLKNALSIMYSKEDILFAALEVNESRVERLCKKVEADKLVKIRKLPSWAGMNRMADLWYADCYDSRNAHYNQTRYHALNLHSVFYHGTLEWRCFNSTLHAGEVKANIILALAISAQAINQKYTQFRKTPIGDNPAFTLRTFLLRLGLIGPEFKNVRMHLLKQLPGDKAWRYDRSHYAQQQTRARTRDEAR